MATVVDPKADTIEGIFGFETKEALFDAIVREKEDTRLGALLAIAIKLESIGRHANITVILILRAITGLELKSPAQVLKYLDDALNDEDIIDLGTKIALTEDERVLEKMKEIFGEEK